MNGYERMHPVGIDVRADMLETVAGYDERDMRREISFALNMTAWDDADQLRWLTTLAARRIAELEAVHV